MFRVPESQVNRAAGEEASFDEPEQEAAGYEGAVGLYQARKGCDDTPGCGYAGDPAGGRDVVF